MAREIILAAYLVTGKEGERAELAEIRGFIHAGSTFRAFRCRNPGARDALRQTVFPLLCAAAGGRAA
jgi:hypothetical protein